MRRAIGIAVVVAIVACTPKEVAAPPREIDFKSELGRYGEWILIRPYGRVWHPNEGTVGKGFVPYLTGGQWKHGPDGWEFESKWGWGEYTFHRGRWFLGETGMGWVWWPDQERAASWVEWRAGSDFVGWTPLPPLNPNARPMLPSDRPWNFVKTRVFTQAELTTHVLSGEGFVKAFQQTTELAAEKLRRGPDVEFVRAAGGLTADGGVPDLTPPPDPNPPPAVETQPEEPPKEEAPPPPPKKKKRKGKKGK